MEEKKPRGVISYFLHSWRVTFLIIIGVALAGALTAISLPRESTPEVKIPFANVVTVFPSASSRDVEELVTNPVEEKLEALDGVKEITSTSRSGVSSVFVEFNAEEDLDDAIRRLRETVDEVTDLPEDAQDPRVIEISFENEPIISISVGGPFDLRLLTIYAEELANRVESISGISGVTVVGGRTETVEVKLDPRRLADSNISVAQVISALRAANINSPFGQIESDSLAWDLRLQGRFKSVADVAGVNISTPSGPVPLGELGSVLPVISDQDTSSRVSIDGKESAPAVTIQVTKKTGGNIVDIVDNIKKEIEKEKTTILPEGIVIEAFADRAQDIKNSLDSVIASGQQTFGIVLIILWLFLGWREALITSLAVPLTFATSLLVFNYFGITLNGISLFSLILSLGLLVDNAIVIIEGVHRGVGRPGLRDHTARMVERFKKPLVGGTLTTVAAFFPMLLVSGIIGEFLRTIPIVVSATLLSSLLVALFFMPAIATQALRRVKPRTEKRRFEKYFDKVESRYTNLMESLLAHRRTQNIFIGSLVVILFLGLSLPFTGLLNTALFPSVDADFITINIQLPPSSLKEKTVSAVEDVENIIRQYPEVKSYVATIGAGSMESGSNRASVYLNLRPDRKNSSIEVSDSLRSRFTSITYADVMVQDVEAGPPTGSPVELRVVGPELDQLADISDKIARELEQVPGAIDIDTDYDLAAGEFTFSLDRQLLADKGLSASDVAFTLRTLKFGTEATSFLDTNDEEIEVEVSAQDAITDSIASILAAPVQNSRGQVVTLGQVATVSLNPSASAIRHRDTERTVTITANARAGAVPNQISTQLQERLASFDIPSGYRVEFGGEQQETEETFLELFRSMGLAVILILLILVIEFNSYSQPLLIFVSIPLALAGVLIGLFIFGGQLNFSAFIGLVSLTGIVVNNAILLVDRMNKLRGQSHSDAHAVLVAVQTRLRPVILTTLTTSLGVMPLIWVDEFFRDLALTLITGLIFSTVLTLVLIPILYLRLQNQLDKRMASRSIAQTPANTV